jgi:hypothetical protein
VELLEPLAFLEGKENKVLRATKAAKGFRVQAEPQESRVFLECKEDRVFKASKATKATKAIKEFWGQAGLREL